MSGDLSQQVALAPGQQGQRIIFTGLVLLSLLDVSQRPVGLQGGQRIGGDDVKAVVRTLRAGGSQQHGPGQVVKAGEQRMERHLVFKMVDMQRWFHFLLHRQQFTACSLAGTGVASVS
ncbi:hypothetical protein Ri1_22020 [Aeromonas dhakensis]|nr:hypothetical protein Ri1_22020 [Aeromonas dhakensis]